LNDLIGTMIYAALSVFAAWLFYDSLPAAFVSVPFYFLFRKVLKAHRIRKDNEKLAEEFLRALVSVSTSISAGISAENAFVIAASDMEKLYGKGRMTRELGIINTQVGTGARLTDALYDLARRTNIQEIYDFAVVFKVAKEKGSDLSAVISSCSDIMEAKRESECEARVMIRAKQYEQRVMCIIPPGILLYLRLSSGSFIEVLYHNPLGIVIMTVCLMVYVLAICLSEKIGDVRV